MKIVRSLAKQLPHLLLCRLYHHIRLREESARAVKAAARAGLPLLETLDLPSLRASNTLFILGSAWSINDISDERWQVIGKHDSVGINFWLAHPFVPRFFHFEDIAYDDQPIMYEAFQKLFERRSEAYANTLKIITEVSPIGGRQTIFELPEGMKKNLYVGFSMPVVARNEDELRTGLRYMRAIGAFLPRAKVAWLFKYGGSVIAMLTLGVIMGYKRMILCGVDLNQQDYFYQHPERYPECADWEFVSRTDPHLTTRRLPWLVPAQSAVYLFKELVLEPEGIELYVENRVSTLCPRVPLASQLLFEQLANQGALLHRSESRP
ncbi:MAG TPA: hypothetical protein VKH40_01740 [Alloacidobacterium sp.]|nr:hypothetical protein [Alloacidobacterium sp.]